MVFSFICKQFYKVINKVNKAKMKYDLDHCKSLLKERKLILICDLDDTLISSMYLNNNYLNPNFDESIVVAFSEEKKKNKYIYIKLRPYLKDFLKEMSNIFELHLMSLGNAEHVKKCLKVIDPKGEYFADRVTSRDNMLILNDKAKTTKEMFLGCSNIIISLDDNIDVWNHSPTLLNIKPLNYFHSLSGILKRCPFTSKEHIQIYLKDHLRNIESKLKDNSLLVLQSVLKDYQHKFFKILDEENSNETKIVYPDIAQIMGKKDKSY